jgi:hypothetical protein
MTEALDGKLNKALQEQLGQDRSTYTMAKDYFIRGVLSASEPPAGGAWRGRRAAALDFYLRYPLSAACPWVAACCGLTPSRRSAGEIAVNRLLSASSPDSSQSMIPPKSSAMT